MFFATADQHDALLDAVDENRSRAAAETFGPSKAYAEGYADALDRIVSRLESPEAAATRRPESDTLTGKYGLHYTLGENAAGEYIQGLEAA